MSEPPPKPDSQTQRTRRPRMNLRQRLLMSPAVWLVTIFTWFVRLTCRVTVVQGGEQLAQAQARGGIVIPCGWHQRLLISGIFLAMRLPRGMRAGFLISPSREGEFIARVASNHGTVPVRGSSSHGGGRQALSAAISGMSNGVSPMMFGDGPRGPAGVFKRGAVVLAQRSSHPMLAIGCALDRYWQLKSWDNTLVPKPFAHFTVALGELWDVPSDYSPEQIDAIAVQVGKRIDELTAAAEAALR